MRLDAGSVFRAIALALLLAAPSALAQTSAPARQGFPAADPESVSMSKAALDALDKVVQGYVERDEAVGAELLVIKNRKTVLHTAHGLRDMKTREPMKPGDISCIRSQTKSVIGTAIQMLIDDGKITLNDAAAKYIPAFDNDTHRTITIEQLLEHRSGLPLSSLLKTDHKTLGGIGDVAKLAGEAKLEFEPGTDFNYSDDGADTLTAIIERTSGMSAADFITQRILQPLGMNDTICVLKKNDPRLPRVNPLHAGGPHAWTRFWAATEDEPLFPYLLGSQSMYSTCEDYARLLCLWADDGVAPRGTGKRLLSHAAVERGLTAASDMGYPTQFKGLQTRYGQLWMLWTKQEAAATRNDDAPREAGPPRSVAHEKVIAFGHGGSDGTCGWMWPQQDLIVLYYTQSRGGLTVLNIEADIDRLLIRGQLAPDAATVSAASLQECAGVYWSEERQQYIAFWPADGKLRVEIQGTAIADLAPADDKDEWKFELQPTVRIWFERNPAGTITGGSMGQAGVAARNGFTRLAPAADVPGSDEVVKKVIAAHGVANLPQTTVIKRDGAMNMPAVKVSGPYAMWLMRDRARIDIEARGVRTIILITPEGVWTKRGDAKPEQQKGALAEQARQEQPLFVFGDWRALAKTLTVLKRVESRGKPALLVRATFADAYPCAMVVDEESGRVLEQYHISNIAGLGAIGAVSEFEDFEAVGGALLPRHTTTTYITPLLGAAEVRFESQGVVKDAKADDIFKIDAPTP